MYTVEVEKENNGKKIIDTAEFSSYKMADEYIDMLSSDKKFRFKYGKDEIPRHLKPQKYTYGSNVVSISNLGTLVHISLSKEYPNPDAELVYVKEDLRNDLDKYVMIRGANIQHKLHDSSHYLTKESMHGYNIIGTTGDDSYTVVGYTTPIYDTNDPITHKILTGIPYYNFENTLVLSYGMNDIHHYILADAVASLGEYIFNMECYPRIGASLYLITKHDKIFVDRLRNAHIIAKNKETSTLYIDTKICVFD